MKKILLTSWLTDTLFAHLPFLEKKAPWYRRYRFTASPWVPAALATPWRSSFSSKQSGGICLPRRPNRTRDDSRRRLAMALHNAATQGIVGRYFDRDAVAG